MRYYSKRDLWLGLVIWIPMLIGLVSTGFATIVCFQAITLIAFVIFVLVVGFTSWIWFSTFYIIDEKYLFIKCGPIRQRIQFENIKSVRRSRNPLSSLALSLDRIEIKYGKMGMTLISPKSKEEFLAELRERCAPGIVEM